ncbi:phosphomannomutase/phosphoglucomutase [Alphaproteobacteria bacterium]|nr:phosphomannomutase/phosphoglucomutase [Alphaproteobacteria bacterium]
MAYHTFHPSILRLNDIRGIVGETLFERDAYVIGQCVGSIMQGLLDKGKVVVGYDGRTHSIPLSKALMQGLKSTGQHVICVGMGPTPMINFAERFLKADAAIMITGSHNPSDFNGFKISIQKKSLMEDDIQALGKMGAAGNLSQQEGFIETDDTTQDAYVDMLLKGFEDYYTDGRPLTIGWDSGNGAMGDVLQQLVKRLPGTHHLINETVDGTFPAHHPDPTVPENLVQLQELVSKKECDLGIAFDGDGDRIGAIDNQGEILWGDQLLLFYGQEILKNAPGSTIIADIKASQTLFDAIEALGGKPLMWRTGHSMIKGKMIETKAPLAGEMSGHMFFADRYFGFDDALYAALRLIGPLSCQEKTLHEWRQCLPPVINTPEIRFACDDDKKFKIVEDIKRRVRLSHDKLIDIDGIRVIYPEGWWLLRASNTQNALIARVEANSAEGLMNLKKDLQAHLKRSGLHLPFEEAIC